MEKTLHPNRMKTCVFLLLCLVGVRLGRGESWLLTFAAGAGVAIFAISLLPGASWLKLDEQGFTVTSLFKQRSTRWVDVDAILVVTQRHMGIIPVNRMVGWTYARSYQKSTMLKASRLMVNFDALLPDTYGMKAADLAALMEAWRQRAVAHHRAA